MSSENGHDGDEDRVLASTMAWPESWRLNPAMSIDAQLKTRRRRLDELRERFGEEEGS